MTAGEAAPPRALESDRGNRFGHDAVSPGGTDRASGTAGTAHRFSELSLVLRAFLLNAAVLIAAVVALAVTPVTVSSPIVVREAVILGFGLTALLAVNFLVLRRAFSPLIRLSRVMRTVDPLTPGERVPEYGTEVEVLQLTAAFNDMLERLERERRQSVRRTLAAQEGERRRVAQELHDEVGQMLTAVLLQLEQLGRSATEADREQLREVKEAARSSLEGVRSVAQRLRPEALDDLGLRNAMVALCRRISDQSGLVVDQSIDPVPAGLSPEVELVIYRVTQEALTNVLRHADAHRVTVTLSAGEGSIKLRVADDGRGLDANPAGAGMQGMRERALLVGGAFDASPLPTGGTEVTLELEAGPRSR